jgi:hypothetical protein
MIYCAQAENRIHYLGHAFLLQQNDYTMFMLKGQNSLSTLCTYSFCFTLKLNRAVCGITNLKSRNKQRNKITNRAIVSHCVIKAFGTNFNSEHFNAC